MTRFRGLPWVGTLSLVLLTAACGQGDPAGPGESGFGVPAFLAGDEVVVRAEYRGGFVPPELRAARLPIVSVYGDGRVITEGPVDAIYPGPALPNVQVQQISTADVRRLADRAIAAGVGRPLDLGEPPVADAPSTRFTVLTDSGPKATEVLALGEASGDGLRADQRAARAQLRELLAALTDLPRTLGDAAVGPSTPYVATALAAVASPWADPDDSGIATPQELSWPGPALPGEPFSAGLELSCVAVSGDQAAQLLALTESATTITPWVSGGTRWRMALRPLLPDEADCSDLRWDD